MPKLLAGLSSAALRLVVVGVAFPYALEYFAPTISSYVPLPPPAQVWTSFVLFGALFAAASFLQTAYSKGEFPWLFGKVGGGVVNIAFFTFLFLFLPKTVGSAGIQSTGLLSLIYLAVGLSYLYLVLDFIDARRTKAAPTKEPDAPSYRTGPTP
jgi:hypothetical protein